MKKLLRRIFSTEFVGYGRYFLIYILVCTVLFAPVLFSGRVISPVSQRQYLGPQKPQVSESEENPKFSDYVTYAIPEAATFLQGKRSGWITTWMPYNELGRPTSHLSDLSPAYLPNWVLSKLTADPFVYVTAISILAMLVAGVFAFLLAYELKLAPPAALIAGISLGLSPSLIYWVTFPMFACAYGWAAAIMFGLVRLIRCGDLLAWSIIAFATYSMLMTAYPVMVMYHAYLIIGFFIFLAITRPEFPRDIRGLTRLFFAIGSAIIFGAAAALPAMADTLASTLQSARLHPNISFLRANIPSLHDFMEWRRYIAFWTFPQILGDPISETFPVGFNGRYLTPIAVFLLCASNLRRTWGWWLATVALAMMDASSSFFAFAASHLGLGLSRSVPSVHAIIPLTMIATTSVDFHLRRHVQDAQPRSKKKPNKTIQIVVATTIYLLLMLNAISLGLEAKTQIDSHAFWVALVYLPLLIVSLHFRLPGIIVGLAILHLLAFDGRQLLTQQRSAIAQSSALTEKLNGLLGEHARYAVLGNETTFMPPNMNAQMKLSSIHSYDSLSPLRYQALIQRLGGKLTAFDRDFTSIDVSAMDSIDFHLANIGAVLTSKPIKTNMAEFDSQSGNLMVYRISDPWGGYNTFDLPSFAHDENSATLNNLAQTKRHVAVVISDQGDTVQLQLAPTEDGIRLLVASKTYYSGWIAKGLYKKSWQNLHTLPVDDAYEGVLIPSGFTSIELTFKPWIRWAWIELT